MANWLEKFQEFDMEIMVSKAIKGGNIFLLLDKKCND
jgi:hypothetical protein